MRYFSTKNSQKLPLQFLLVIPFLLQILTAVGLVGYLSFRNGQKAVNDLASQLMDKTENLVRQHLNTFLVTPHQINKINAKAVERNLLNLRDYRRAGHYFWQQMQIFNVGYIYYVLPTGEYAGAGYFLDLNNVTIDELSGNTKWQANTYATDSQGNRTKLVASYSDYNPLEEAAYTDVVAAAQPIWSKIYQWDNFPDIISISASYPLYQPDQTLMGVLVVNLRLSQISNFLRNLHVSPSGKTVILERNGFLVASSSAEKPFKDVDGKAQRLKAVESHDELIRETAQFLMKKFGDLREIQADQSLDFTLKGQRQFVHVSPWSDRYGLDWLVVNVVPESDFMAQIYANTRTTIFLCLAALVIAVILGFFTARWITQPILELSRASEAIASGDLDQSVEINAIREFNILAHSFNLMAEQIKESFTALEKSNTELENRIEERTKTLKENNIQLQETLAELHRTQGQMIQSEKMSALGQMVAGIAHEINNPVGFIYSNLSHLEEYTQSLMKLVESYQGYYPNPPEGLQTILDDLEIEFLRQDLVSLLHSMKVGANRIREIILSLRNFSRLDEADFKAVDIHQGIENSLMILQHRLKGDNKHPEIQVIKEYGDIPLVECYAGQLNQVFMNLLVNAVDALEDAYHKGHYPSVTPNSATLNQRSSRETLMIWIRTSRCNANTIGIQIADNGIGMSDEVRSQLFNPFFTTKPIGKGTGLGLSISYQIIVEKHRGKLSCDPRPEGGTEFRIELPIRATLATL